MDAKEFFKRLIPPKKSLEDAYNAGRDYAESGATEQNCHFALFCSPEHTAEWERGRNEFKPDSC